MGQGVLSVFWAILSGLVLYVWGSGMVWTVFVACLIPLSETPIPGLLVFLNIHPDPGAYFRITRLSECFLLMSLPSYKSPAQGFWDGLTAAGTAMFYQALWQV